MAKIGSEIESLDIYDSSNRPLGFVKKRSLVHKEGDWHRVAHIYVVDGKGWFLAHLRSLSKDLHPGKWDTRFGGHVTSGQTVEDTAVSELHQEIGLRADLSELKPARIYSYDGKTNREHVHAYFFAYKGNGKDLKFVDSEVVEVKWMAPEEIINEMTKNPGQWAGRAQNFKLIWEKWKELKLSHSN